VALKIEREEMLDSFCSRERKRGTQIQGILSLYFSVFHFISFLFFFFSLILFFL